MTLPSTINKTCGVQQRDFRGFEDVSLVEFMYAVFIARQVQPSYRKRLGSLLLLCVRVRCLTSTARAQITSHCLWILGDFGVGSPAKLIHRTENPKQTKTKQQRQQTQGRGEGGEGGGEGEDAARNDVAERR